MDNRPEYRFERTGDAEPITPRIERFLETAMGGKSLDLDGDKYTRPDFECLRGLLVVEIKTLEGDPQPRLDAEMNEKRNDPNWPLFFGKWPLQSIVKHLPDGDELTNQMVERLGKPFGRHLQKANKQLAAHDDRRVRTNGVNVVILVNEDHAQYDPEVTSQLLLRELARGVKTGDPKYRHIDAVIYISERHAAMHEGRVTFPIVEVDGPELHLYPWKQAVLDLIAARWSTWNGFEPKGSTEFEDNKFVEIEPVPERMRAHERWRLDYRRNPYMADWSEGRLLAKWDELYVLGVAAFYKNTPIKPPDLIIRSMMVEMTHITEEAARRGYPLASAPQDNQRIHAAARRLGADPSVIDDLLAGKYVPTADT
ncbi:hypothetical protein [Oricola indica]|uniref:hypothetical protein n=1 Tax=Oricola indica TaxID=2872591 RepID=UPI001CC052C7|nr:hypothetical protein [Oricola indica]